MRSLAGEIGQEYTARKMKIVGGVDEDGTPLKDTGGIKAMDEDGDADVSDLMELVDDIVPFHLEHNAEAEAVDLLVEVQVLGQGYPRSRPSILREAFFEAGRPPRGSPLTLIPRRMPGAFAGTDCC